MGYREGSGLGPRGVLSLLSTTDYGLSENSEDTMSKADLERYRTVLLAMRTRLTGDVSHLADEALRARGGEASGSLSNAPLHPADLGTDNYQQEFTFNLLQNQEQALEEITEAIDRLDRGAYGRCE